MGLTIAQGVKFGKLAQDIGSGVQQYRNIGAMRERLRTSRDLVRYQMNREQELVTGHQYAQTGASGFEASGGKLSVINATREQMELDEAIAMESFHLKSKDMAQVQKQMVIDAPMQLISGLVGAIGAGKGKGFATASTYGSRAPAGVMPSVGMDSWGNISGYTKLPPTIYSRK